MPGMRAAAASASAPGVSCTKVRKPEALHPDSIIGFTSYCVAKEISAENWSRELEGTRPAMPVIS